MKFESIFDDTSVENLLPEESASGPNREEIATRAYYYWEERGCPEGCAEEDWFRAEAELAQ
jgi:hypothetical protein